MLNREPLLNCMHSDEVVVCVPCIQDMQALSPIPRLTPPSELSISDPSIPEENRPGGTNLHPHEPITVMSGLPTRAQTYEVLQDAEPEQTQEDFGRLRDAGKGEGSQKLLKLPRSNLPKQEVAVRTKEELDRVMREGAEHIVLLNHLDFQHLESPAALSIIPDTLQSLRVRFLLFVMHL